jgi:hypothetical protein
MLVAVKSTGGPLTDGTMQACATNCSYLACKVD